MAESNATNSAPSKNAISMPLVGFGTYQLSDEGAEKSVTESLNVGYRHIDSAQAYLCI